MLHRLKYLALGCLTHVPGLHARLRRGTGGTNSGLYCYSVWMRHWVLARRSLPDLDIAHVAELGPGDSLGAGLTALLCGARSYSALDSVGHASGERNVRVFNELVELLASRHPVVRPGQLPDVHPDLDDLSFPRNLLPDELLNALLAECRIDAIRRDAERLQGKVSYRPHWFNKTPLDAASVDFMFSQAVLEHVDDLAATYGAMYRWLRPGAVMSHQIDLKSHGMSPEWNGHLGYEDLTWKLMRGRLPYLLNRKVASTHLSMVREAGFDIVDVRRIVRHDGLARSRLARRFKDLQEEDMCTAGLYLLARKPR